jgi:uncharacterized membrane protein YozB (DUF420 family)
MRRELWLGAALIAVGITALILAPQAQSCVTDFDATVCETGATVILNVAGACLLVAGGILVVLRARHKIRA